MNSINFSSRMFTLLMLTGLTVIMVTGYQNCGNNPQFKKTGSGGEPECTSGPCSNVGPAPITPDITVSAFNGKGIPVLGSGPINFSTCTGLSAQEISQGLNKGVQIQARGTHSMQFFMCAREFYPQSGAPQTDNLPFSCEVAGNPGKTPRLDFVSPSAQNPLGTISYSLQNRNADLAFENLAYGLYIVEMRGVVQNGSSQFQTLPRSVIINVNDCSAASPTTSFSVTGVMGKDENGNWMDQVPNEWLLGTRGHPAFVITKKPSEFESFFVDVNVNSAQVTSTVAGLTATQQQNWEGCTRQVVPASEVVPVPTGVLPAGQQGWVIELPNCKVIDNENRYNVVIGGVDSTANGDVLTWAQGSPYNFQLMPTSSELNLTINGIFKEPNDTNSDDNRLVRESRLPKVKFTVNNPPNPSVAGGITFKIIKKLEDGSVSDLCSGAQVLQSVANGPYVLQTQDIGSNSCTFESNINVSFPKYFVQANLFAGTRTITLPDWEFKVDLSGTAPAPTLAALGVLAPPEDNTADNLLSVRNKKPTVRLKFNNPPSPAKTGDLLVEIYKREQGMPDQTICLKSQSATTSVSSIDVLVEDVGGNPTCTFDNSTASKNYFVKARFLTGSEIWALSPDFAFNVNDGTGTPGACPSSTFLCQTQSVDPLMPDLKRTCVANLDECCGSRRNTDFYTYLFDANKNNYVPDEREDITNTCVSKGIEHIHFDVLGVHSPEAGDKFENENWALNLTDKNPTVRVSSFRYPVPINSILPTPGILRVSIEQRQGAIVNKRFCYKEFAVNDVLSAPTAGHFDLHVNEAAGNSAAPCQLVDGHTYYVKVTLSVWNTIHKARNYDQTFEVKVNSGGGSCSPDQYMCAALLIDKSITPVEFEGCVSSLKECCTKPTGNYSGMYYYFFDSTKDGLNTTPGGSDDVSATCGGSSGGGSANYSIQGVLSPEAGDADTDEPWVLNKTDKNPTVRLSLVDINLQHSQIEQPGKFMVSIEQKQGAIPNKRVCYKELIVSDLKVSPTKPFYSVLVNENPENKALICQLVDGATYYINAQLEVNGVLYPASNNMSTFLVNANGGGSAATYQIKGVHKSGVDSFALESDGFDRTFKGTNRNPTFRITKPNLSSSLGVVSSASARGSITALSGPRVGYKVCSTLLQPSPINMLTDVAEIDLSFAGCYLMDGDYTFSPELSINGQVFKATNDNFRFTVTNGGYDVEMTQLTGQNLNTDGSYIQQIEVAEGEPFDIKLSYSSELNTSARSFYFDFQVVSGSAAKILPPPNCTDALPVPDILPLTNDTDNNPWIPRRPRCLYRQMQGGFDSSVVNWKVLSNRGGTTQVDEIADSEEYAEFEITQVWTEMWTEGGNSYVPVAINPLKKRFRVKIVERYIDVVGVLKPTADYKVDEFMYGSYNDPVFKMISPSINYDGKNILVSTTNIVPTVSTNNKCLERELIHSSEPLLQSATTDKGLYLTTKSTCTLSSGEYNARFEGTFINGVSYKIRDYKFTVQTATDK